MKKLIQILCVFILGWTSVYSQQVYFQNPSFEDTLRGQYAPALWTICYGTPDVQPLHQWMIAPSNGLSYAAMGAATWGWRESIGQTLENELQIGQQYHFSIDLAYVLYPAFGHEGPGILQVWLGNNTCDKSQLIYETAVLDTFWTKHFINFIPNYQYSSISFNVELYDSSQHNYIFLDNLSVIDTGFALVTSIQPNMQTKSKIVNYDSGFMVVNDSGEMGFIRIFSVNGVELYNSTLYPGLNSINPDRKIWTGILILVVNVGNEMLTRKIMVN